MPLPLFNGELLQRGEAGRARRGERRRRRVRARVDLSSFFLLISFSLSLSLSSLFSLSILGVAFLYTFHPSPPSPLSSFTFFSLSLSLSLSWPLSSYPCPCLTAAALPALLVDALFFWLASPFAARCAAGAAEEGAFSPAGVAGIGNGLDRPGWVNTFSHTCMQATIARSRQDAQVWRRHARFPCVSSRACVQNAKR